MANGGYDMFSSGPELNDILTATKNFGLTLAAVTSIDDPEKLNRVKCRLAVSGQDDDIKETDWCPVVMPFSGKTHGAMFMPNKDDLVLLAFLNGDPQCPYVVGGTWNSDSPPPYTVEGGKNNHYCIKTLNGSELLFYDEKGKELIDLATPTGALLTLNDAEKQAILADGKSKNSVKLDWSAGSIQVTSEKELSLVCGSAKLTLKSDGTVAIEGKKITVSGTDVALEGKNSFKATGSTSDVEAKTSLNLKGVNTALQGTAGVNIN